MASWGLPLLLGGATVAVVLAATSSASAKTKKKTSPVPGPEPVGPPGPLVPPEVLPPEVEIPDWAESEPGGGFAPDELPASVPEGTIYDPETGQVLHQWSSARDTPFELARAWTGNGMRWFDLRDYNARPRGEYSKVTNKVNDTNVTWLDIVNGQLLAIPPDFVKERARRERLGL